MAFDRPQRTATIFIQGHGNEYWYGTNKIMLDKHNMHIQSIPFSGIPGESGLMNICPDDEPVDIKALNSIRKLYNDTLKHHSQLYKFHKVSSVLKNEYENCGIHYNYRGGFSIITPVYEKQFILNPSPHENCRICVTKGSKYCRTEYQSKKKCPEYGITVVDSNNPDDFAYTLVGSDRPRYDLNWSNTKSDVFKYWCERVIMNTTSDEELDIIIQILYRIEIEKTVFLSDILYLFYKLGYTDLYVLDPTCRTCNGEIVNKTLKYHASRIMADIKERKHSKTEKKRANVEVYKKLQSSPTRPSTPLQLSTLMDNPFTTSPSSPSIKRKKSKSKSKSLSKSH
jgi:hypothetical protein